jgi:O-antigen/teichoic acid export membrane protein
LRSLDIAWLQAPLVILGSSAPASVVGIYQRMQFLADLGMQMTVWRVSSVLYAALAQRSTGHEIDKEQYRAVLTIITVLVLPIIAFALVAGHAIVAVLLGQNWLAGVSSFRLLIVAFGIATINQAAGMALEHAGRLKQRAASAALAVTLIVALLLLVPRGRPELYALPALISMACSSVLLHLMVGERGRDVLGVLKTFAPGLLLALATGAGAFVGGVALGNAWTTLPPVAVLLSQFSGAIVLNALCVPLVCRLSAMRPLMHLFHRGFPSLFAATHFAHRLSI